MKKHLTVLTTGGTIAMAGSGGGLADLNPKGGSGPAAGLSHLAEVIVKDVLSIPSASISMAHLRTLNTAVRAASDSDGIVITHGTDTMEETAFALQLLATDGPPVILTGAMRRIDQPGADGPANILAAALTALDEASRGKGVLVVMDDEIHWSALVRKSHAFRTHAFASAPFGPIGWVSEGRVRYALNPILDFPHLDIGDRDGIVPIIEVGIDLDPIIVEQLSVVADALVVSLPGAGHVSARAVAALEAAAKKIPLVFASRTGAGATLSASYGYPGSETDLIGRGLIPAGMLDARKARILLLLLHSTGITRNGVAAVFAALP